MPCHLIWYYSAAQRSGGVAIVTQRRTRGEIRYPRSKEESGSKLDTEQLHQKKAQEPLPKPQQLKGLVPHAQCAACFSLSVCVAATLAPKACSALCHMGIERTSPCTAPGHPDPTNISCRSGLVLMQFLCLIKIPVDSPFTSCQETSGQERS